MLLIDDISILLPAIFAGMLVVMTHVPLGIQVLGRGIIFIDLAIAQIAGSGVILANMLGFEGTSWGTEVIAINSALLGGLLLTLTEKFWPHLQEAIIGVVFVLAATGSILLLAQNPHGGEHLKEILVGQILWVKLSDLIPIAIAYTAVIFSFLFLPRISRLGFYILFSLSVTLSVQLVGIYLVFSSLIIPALLSEGLKETPKGRLGIALFIGVMGYVTGLFFSLWSDLPASPMIVWCLLLIGAITALFFKFFRGIKLLRV